MPRGKPAPASAAVQVTTAADDLAIMHPDVTLTIAGREVTVREYRFIDGMRARGKGKPIIDELQAMMASGELVNAVVEDYLGILARHPDLTRELMLDAIDGADPDWLDALSEDDGFALQVQWWGVCGRFFARIIMRYAAERMMEQVRRAGPTSSASSRPPATETHPTSSTGIRSAN